MRTFKLIFLAKSFTSAIYIPPDENDDFRIERNLPTNHLNFSILGDWGGFPKPWFTTPIQQSAAKLLGPISKDYKSQFNLAIGDNFYFRGVKDVRDEMWFKTFENVYTHKSLQNPWYPLFGNHDWQGNVSAQIDYSRFSNRWTAPNFWYTLDYTFGDPGQEKQTQVRFLMIDAPIQCDSGKFDKYYPYDYPTKPTLEQKADQLKWLEQELISSAKFEYVFVVSHYQIHTPNSHYSCMDEIDELLVKYDVTAFLYGHAHELAHSVNKKNGVNYLCSGIGALIEPGGGARDNSKVEVKYFWRRLRHLKGGFVMGQIGQEEAVFRYYLAESSDNDHVPVYETSLKGRK